MHFIIPILVVLVGCIPSYEEPTAEPSPKPLTKAQRDWVSDVCVPAALRGGYAVSTAGQSCRRNAPWIVKQ